MTESPIEKRNNSHVAILDVNTELGISLQEELRSKYGANSVKFIKCDVTKDLDAAYNETTRDFGYIDVVINNAGIMNDAPHIYEKEIDINVTALIKSSLKAYNIMHKKHGGNGGTIINISSIVGLIQTYALPVYSATKSAVLQFSNCLGAEQNFIRSEVRVVTICFGCTKTNLIQGIVGGIEEELDNHIKVGIEKLPHQNQTVFFATILGMIDLLTYKKGKEKQFVDSVDSAVKGLIEAYEKGASGSTWLVTSGRSAEEITGHVTSAFEILSQGVYS